MKKLQFLVRFVSIALIASCNNEGSHSVTKATDTSTKNLNTGISRNDSLKTKVARDSSLPKDTARKVFSSDTMRSKILGIWGSVEDENKNATFVIDKKKITYVDQDRSFKYFLLDDSIHIKYDGFDGNYLVKMRGIDTMVLSAKEESVFYRFKK